MVTSARVSCRIDIRAYVSSFRCLFISIPPPPSSTLFPYTTLFRSRLSRSVDREHDHLGGDRDRRGHRARPQDVLDRKSTRLNSSHGYISYAVFCLKKKSLKRTQTTSPSSITRLAISAGRAATRRWT